MGNALSKIALAISLSLSATSVYAADKPALTLLTADQRRIDQAAIALLQDPQIKAARDGVLKTWSALPPFATEDGKARLASAVDELVFFSVRAAVDATQATPSIVWNFAPPYTEAGVKVPGSRWGIELPDRIYRMVAVDPASRYVIKGQRNARPSNGDFLFEASDGIRTLSSVGAKDIDVAADGSFTVTIDAAPASGQRNHLALPAGVKSLLIRDTLADWHTQLPNRLTIAQVGGGAPPHATLDDTRKAAVAVLAGYAKFTAGIIQAAEQQPLHTLTPQVRSAELGVAGSVIGLTRFSLADDEALVLTIDPQGAGYTNIQLTDPWTRSIAYWNTVTSLSNRQAKVSADGTISYIVSPRDPGFQNWLSSDGLHHGLAVLRIEQVATPDVATIVRSAKVVKFADLAAALPADLARVAPAERASERAVRAADFTKRLTN